jgi:hypothetical protein
MVIHKILIFSLRKLIGLLKFSELNFLVEVVDFSLNQASGLYFELLLNFLDLTERRDSFGFLIIQMLF